MPIVIVIFIVIGAFLTGNGMMNPQVEPDVTSEEIKAVTEEVKITPSSSPTSTPILLPSFTPVPKPMATSDPDPYIKCRFKSGVKELRKSQCDSMVDCQLYGETWVPATKEKCSLTQSEIASLLLNALKNKSSQYVQSVIDNYSSRSYGNYDYQQPYTMPNPSPSEQPKINVYGGSEMYTQIGDTTFGSKGDYQTRIGDTTFRSDGSYYTQIGDTVFDSDGSYHQRLGDTVFSNDGNYSTRIGDTTFGSDGSYSTQIGDTTFINP